MNEFICQFYKMPRTRWKLTFFPAGNNRTRILFVFGKLWWSCCWCHIWGFSAQLHIWHVTLKYLRQRICPIRLLRLINNYSRGHNFWSTYANKLSCLSRSSIWRCIPIRDERQRGGTAADFRRGGRPGSRWFCGVNESLGREVSTRILW